VFLRITLRLVMLVGGSLFLSVKKALQIICWLALEFVVTRTRADPLSAATLRTLSAEKGAGAVANSTVAPGATARAVADASFRAAPPAGPKTSTPTITVEPSVFVHAIRVARVELLTTPGTDHACTAGSP
jgi:hypothetical protein